MMRYLCPRTLTEYFECVASAGDSSYTVLSGGTDLMPRFEQGVPLPDYLIDVKRIDELSCITVDENGVTIGALTTIEMLKQSALIQQRLRALWLATRDFAGVQIRNRATIGGNICNASPAGDTLPPLYVYRAGLRLVGPQGERELPIAEFIQGPGRVALAPGELLHSIRIPTPVPDSTFVKLGLRQAMAIAVVNFAARYRLEQGRFSHLELAAGAVAPTVVTLRAVAGRCYKSGHRSGRRWNASTGRSAPFPISALRRTTGVPC
jgi:CO/xanthine dehydrogenase FAD-binding subunit